MPQVSSDGPTSADPLIALLERAQVSKAGGPDDPPAAASAAAGLDHRRDRPLHRDRRRLGPTPRPLL